jgi:SPP1 gp7 family putative phage head morphogenesis protein
VALSAADKGRALSVVGRPAELIEQAKIDLTEVTSNFLGNIAAAAESATSVEEVQAQLQRFAALMGDSAELNQSLWQPMLQADLGGQLMVRDVELPGIRVVKNAAEATDPFLRMPFLDAIEFFRSRTLLSAEQLSRLIEEYKARGQEAALLLLQRVNDRVVQVLQAQLENGLSFRDFARDVRAGDANLGIEAKSDWYLETVFRAQVGVAYGAGRQRQMLAPAVAEAFPCWEYRDSRDSRVRPSHRALHGLVFEKSDSEALRIMPPGGFGCRCVAVSRGPEYLDKVAKRLPEGAGPDAGWDRSPIDMATQ